LAILGSSELASARKQARNGHHVFFGQSKLRICWKKRPPVRDVTEISVISNASTPAAINKRYGGRVE
jgi:hypothetical protein